MKRILLVGAGHAHLAALLAFAKEPLRGARITLATPRARQIYSGMLPGLIAGHYRRDETEIDVAGLAERAYAQLVVGCIASLDTANRTAVLEDGSAIPYDFMSLNIGSRVASLPGAERALAAKPFELLLDGLHEGASTAVIGGGAGGVELAMALRHSGSAATVYAAHSPFEGRIQQRVQRALRLRGVNMIELQADEILPGGVVVSGKSTAEYEQIVIASGAAPHAWVSSSKLATDNGFVVVDDALRSVSHPEVFACGDCAAQRGASYPRSGVYAVRHGEALARNLHLLVKDLPLQPYRPQKHALLLLSCGGRYAIASRGGFSMEGRLAWRLKNRIDRRWMRKLNGGS